MFRSLLSVVLVASLLWQAGYVAAGPQSEAEASRPEGEVIILSDAIGTEIDREERDRYGLFRSISGFLSAIIIRKPNGRNIAWVTYEEDGQRKHRTVQVSKKALKLLYERVGGIPPAEVQVPETQTPRGQLPLNRTAQGCLLGGMGGSLVGGLIGYALGAQTDEAPYGLLIGVPSGALVGAISGAGIGHALSQRPKQFAFVGGISGGFVGSLVGGFAGLSLGETGDDLFAGVFCGALVGATLGAIIGHLRSRHLKQPGSQSLLRIENSKIRVRNLSPIPRPVASSRGRATWEYQVDLVSVRF